MFRGLTHCLHLLQGIRVCNMLEGGFTPLHTTKELEGMGYSLVLYPLAGLYAATR